MIAFLRDEPGADIVRSHLRGASISTMNYSEVLKKTIEAGGSPDAVGAHVRGLPVAIVPFDVEQAIGTAKLYPVAKPHGLSFADRACLNLGIVMNAPVLTTEKSMLRVDAVVQVQLIRGEH